MFVSGCCGAETVFSLIKLFTSLFILTDCFIICSFVMRVPELLLTLILASFAAP